MNTLFCFDTNTVTVTLTLENAIPGWECLDVVTTVPFAGPDTFDEYHYDFDNFDIEKITSPSSGNTGADISLQLGKSLEDIYVIVREKLEEASENWQP